MRIYLLRRRPAVQNQPTDQNQPINSWLLTHSNAHIPMKYQLPVSQPFVGTQFDGTTVSRSE